MAPSFYEAVLRVASVTVSVRLLKPKMEEVAYVTRNSIPSAEVTRSNSQSHTGPDDT